MPISLPARMCPHFKVKYRRIKDRVVLVRFIRLLEVYLPRKINMGLKRLEWRPRKTKEVSNKFY
jgi:hypothetical protein